MNNTHQIFVYLMHIFLTVVGVTVIETNVEAKSVVVMHDDSVDKMVLDEKLQKVSYVNW